MHISINKSPIKVNGMRVEVVKESAMFKAKEKFRKIISEHLYSVHKPLADLEFLVSSDSGDVNYSTIKYDACKERSDEKIQLLCWDTATKKITMENIMNSKFIDSVNLPKMEKNLLTTKKNGFNNFFNMAKKAKSPEKLKSSFQKKDKELPSVKKDNDFFQETDSRIKNKYLREEVKELIEKEKVSVEKDNDSVQKDKEFSKDTGSVEKNKAFVINSTTKKVSPKNNSAKKESFDHFFGKLTSPKPTEVLSSEKKNDKVRKKFIAKNKAGKKQNLHGRKRNRSKDTDDNCEKMQENCCTE